MSANQQQNHLSQVVDNVALAPATSPAVGATASVASLDSLADIPFSIQFELAETSISIRRLLDLKSGSVVPLPQANIQTVKVVVNDMRLALGEVISLQNHYGIRITEFDELPPCDTSTTAENPAGGAL